MLFPLFMLFTPAICLAEAPAPAAAPAAAATPSLVFDAVHHDFGRIPTDAKVTHRFKVTNQGKGYLNILGVRPSCGCTYAVLGKWSLAPLESTEIEVTFNPAGFHGLSRKSIQVTSNDPISPNQTLTFQAEVVAEVMPSTTSVFFADVVRSSPHRTSVKLESGNGKPVQVTEAKLADAPWLTVSPRQAGLDAWLDITLDARKLPANKHAGADLLTVATSNPKVPSIKITIQWELRTSISVDPPRVAWAEPAGQELSATLTLKQVDGKPFRLLSSKSSNPVLRVELGDKGAASSHRIQVIFAAKAKPGSYMEKILVTTDDPEQPELEVRVSAALNAALPH